MSKIQGIKTICSDKVLVEDAKVVKLCVPGTIFLLNFIVVKSFKVSGSVFSCLEFGNGMKQIHPTFSI